MRRRLNFWYTTAFLAIATLAGPSESKRLPATGHLSFPQSYREKYQVLCRFDKTEKKQVVTVYGNDAAASVNRISQLPYPYGSVLVMETSNALKDSQGNVVIDEKGHYRQDEALGLHVMNKEHGFGEAYREDRTGEWEYVEYRPDGSYITPPEKSVVCARCHLKAGRDRDFVYGGRFHSDSK